MVITQTRSRRSLTGSRYIPARKKKQYEAGGAPIFTKLADRKLKKVRVLGGNHKVKLMSDIVANIVDLKTNKHKRVKILNIIENPANRNFVRRNIITKGTILETENGKARVTSRPGQDGMINAVFV